MPSGRSGVRNVAPFALEGDGPEGLVAARLWMGGPFSDGAQARIASAATTDTVAAYSVHGLTASPVAARHGRRGEYHEDDEPRLNETDAREASGPRHVGELTGRHLPAPGHEGHHRCEFEQHDGDEQHHLAEEDVIGEIVGARLLRSAEPAPEAGDEPEQRGNAPPGIGLEDPAESSGIEWLAKGTAASPHGTKTDAEGQEMDGSEEPAKHSY